MSRIRTIKPDFWEDEKVGQLPIPCRLFFIGCWNFADDFGVIKGNAALLKSQIFPYDENLRVSEIKKWIDALVNARMLIPIIHAEESYYIIRTFRSHQVLDNRYSKSYISKDKSLVSRIVNKALNDNNVNTLCTHCVDDVTTTEEKEMEDKENTSNEVLKKAPLPSHTSDRMDWGAFMQTFNDMLSPGVPKLISMNQSRRDKVKAIVKEYGKDAIMQVFDKICKSDFLMGRNRRPNDDWKCNFDFIFSKSGFIKILEGNYDNGERVQNNIRTNYTSKQEANKYAIEQFIRDREARENGMVDEVEKPF